MSDRPAWQISDRRIAPFKRVRIRQGCRLMSGWRGKATMMPDGRALKDSGADLFWDTAMACGYEWVVLRDQTPNPEHPQTEEEWLERSRCLA
jgi:hypothetical protein